MSKNIQNYPVDKDFVLERDSDVEGGINLMILTQAILKTMFVCCHTTDSLKMPPTKNNIAVLPRF